MRRHLTALTLAALTLAGCSSGDTAGGEPTEDALTDAAEAFTAALLDDPAGSYDYLSGRCRSEWARGDWGANVTAGMALLTGFTGIDSDELEVGEVEVLEFAEGRSALVSVDMLVDGDPAFGDDGEGTDWVYEDRWLADDCEPLGESD